MILNKVELAKSEEHSIISSRFFGSYGQQGLNGYEVDGENTKRSTNKGKWDKKML